MKSGRLYGNHGLSRRTLLRGLLGGAVVTIGLPPLERFLNANGTAYAASGDDGFPRRFGLFFWGNGILPARWTPTAKGMTWELSDQLAPLAAVKSKITVVSGTKVGVPNSQPHGAGAAGVLSGMPLLMQGNNTTFGGPSIDQIIANAIGNETRFRSLEFGAAPGDGYSYNGPNSLNPPESSSYALFQRIFGTGFTMPGDTPKIDPTLGLRQSILDSVGEDIKRLEMDVGAADKQRLEQHFEGIRLLEKRLVMLQEAPAKLDACKVPKMPELDYPDIEGRPQLQLKNQVFAEMMAYSLACDQVRVFSNWFTHPVNNLLFQNAPTGHHELTHNEADPQPEVHKITVQIVEALAAQIAALDAIQEGAGTLLDHMLVVGTSETGLAKTHSLEEIPLVLAGSAGGKIKVGMHYRSEGGENTSKVMLSVCRAVGADLAKYGAEGGEAKDGLSAIEA